MAAAPDLPVEELPVRELEHQLDEVVWFSADPEARDDKPTARAAAVHAERIYGALTGRAGVPDPVGVHVQRLTGHADINTTQRYAHLAPHDLEDAVQVLNRTGNVQPRRKGT